MKIKYTCEKCFHEILSGDWVRNPVRHDAPFVRSDFAQCCGKRMKRNNISD